MKTSVQRHILIHASGLACSGTVRALFLLSQIIVWQQILAAESASPSLSALPAEATVRLVTRSKADRYQTFCSGVSLGDGNVLTAGGCFHHPVIQHHLDHGEVYAQFHQPYRRAKQGLELIQVQGVRGMSTNGSDIALLKLAETPAGKETIPLAFGNCDDAKRVSVGFGLNENGQLSAAPKITQLTDTAAPGSYTPDGYPLFPDEKWLTLKGKVTTCLGDAGGPIFCQSSGKWAVTGIIPKSQTSSAASSTDPHHHFCQTLPRMTAAKVSGQMHRLNSWRNLQPTPFRRPANRASGRD